VKVSPTRLEGPLLIEPAVHGDARGFFTETYRANVFAEHGIDDDWVQDNHSRSRLGVVRGMHYQTDPGQAKLIRCSRGSIVDVVVDVRRGSPTFGEWEAVELSDDNMRQLYVPIGFAHGFCVTSELADVIYKCSWYYVPETEAGFRYDDPDVGIEWPAGIELQPSQRDIDAPLLREVRDELPFRYSEPSSSSSARLRSRPPV
jgi:dTDP-4-dehydrorhamnose 3,5-epimerase